MRGRYPKVSEGVEVAILKKLYAIPTRIKDLYDKEGKTVYYRGSGGGYFQIVTNYPTKSSVENSLYLQSQFADLIAATLSTSLFWWYYQVFSDDLHLKKYEIENFPVPTTNLRGIDTDHIAELYDTYLEDIEKHAEIRQAKDYKVDSFKQYNLRQSLHFIDQLDDAVGVLYGLNQEEIDFIKNYERSFRDDS